MEVVSGRDVSANFDMQSLASLQHGDRILVRRSEHCVRFLHPAGWNYFATLRRKLRWNEGVLSMALKRMVLRDFVIVESLDLELQPGFTVLTGETGAGKSILIDALQIVLGARADTSVVREGAAKADICAEFDVPDHVTPWLEEAGIDAEAAILCGVP